MSKVRTRLRQSARNQDCTVRWPGVCNHDPATTVLAHLPAGKMGGKAPDTCAVYACHACHDLMDRRGNDWRDVDRLQLAAALLRALVETHEAMEREGVL